MTRAAAPKFPRPLVRISRLHSSNGEDVGFLPAEVAPFVRETTQISWDGDRVLSLGAKVDFAIEAREQQKAVGKVLKHLDGRTTLAQVARKTKLDLDEVIGIATPLYAQGFLGDCSDVAIPGVLFFEHARSTGNLWSPPEPQSTFGAVLDGTASERLLLGDMLRGWYGTRAHATHIALAIARSITERSQHAWSRLLAEEYEHCNWLSEGLEKLVTEEELRRFQPLSGQVAIINEARWAASRDELAYAALNAFNETTEEPDVQGAESVTFYRQVVSSGAISPEVVEPQLRHLTFDAQRRHFELNRIPFEEHGPITLVRRQLILEHVRNYVRFSAAMELEQVAYYSDPRNPRVPMGPPELEHRSYHPTTMEEVEVIRRESVMLPRTRGGAFPYTRPRDERR